MIISNHPELGFSITSLAKDVYHVAANPNVQRAAASAAQAYAPGAYSQANQYADVARGLLPPRGSAPPPQMPMPPPGAMVDDGGDGGPAVVHPNVIQKNKLLLPIAIGGGALVLLLLLRR